MFIRLMLKMKDFFLSEQDRFFLWLPVFFGGGIVGYFALAQEPSSICVWIILALVFISIPFLFIAKYRLALAPICMIGIGFLTAFAHGSWGGTSMLKKNHYNTALRGTIERVDYAGYGRRLLIKPDIIPEIPETPNLIKVTLRGHKDIRFQPGDYIQLPAKLIPISYEVLPGGFDFRRKAYFDGIGASGFVAGKPKILSSKAHQWGYMIEHIRDTITQRIEASVPSQSGAIAAALVTGDTSRVKDATRQYFASSGIAHLLAISGLHLNLVGLIIFAVLRLMLCFVPLIALKFHVKKIAACITILGLFFYLQISGAAIPSQRAFIMAFFVMLALVIDRISLSLRLVAIAAWLVMIWKPHALLTPSFQLSFAAVIALIVAYESVVMARGAVMSRGFMRKIWGYFFGIFTTTMIASTVVLPLTIYHFHQLTLQSLLANMAAIPLMAFWIMPWLFVSILVMPFGLERIPLLVATEGIHILEYLAQHVSEWPGALIQVTHPPLWAFVMLILSALWLAIWRQRWRFMALPTLMIGMIGLFYGTPADILFSQDAKYYAFKDGDDMWFSGYRTKTFLSKNWSASMGVYPDHIKRIQGKKAPAPLVEVEGDIHKFTLKGRTIAILNKAYDVEKGCPNADIVLAQEALKRKRFSCPSAAVYLDYFDFRYKGPYAFFLEEDGRIRVQTRADKRDARPWS